MARRDHRIGPVWPLFGLSPLAASAPILELALLAASVPILGLALLAAPMPAAAASLTVSLADCARLTRHVPAADVAYQPDVDVHGNAVVPADLDGGLQVDLPETFSFDVQIQPIDFARRRQLEAQRAALAADVAANQAEAEGLALEAADLSAQRSGFLNDFEEQAQRIIDATGGPGETNAAILANRTAQLDALAINQLNSPEFVAIDANIAAVEEAQAVNRATAAALAQDGAALDQEAALIEGRGLSETTLTVGTVTVNTATGRAYFNGQPLQDEEQARLAELCQQRLSQNP